MYNNEKPADKRRNPRAISNYISSLLFLYLIPVFYRSYQREFTENDLYEPLKEDKSETLSEMLGKNWKHAKRKHKKWTLHLALFKTFGCTFITGGILVFIKDIARILFIPYTIGKLVSYFAQTSLHSTEDSITSSDAYIYATALVACLLFERLIAHPVMFLLQHMSMKMRIACCGMIYGKVLRFDKSTSHTITVGKVINLMTNDLARFDHSFAFIHFVWIAPIQTLCAIAYLYMKIGSACFLGVGLLLLIVPAQLLTAKKIASFRLRTAQSTDVRVRLMNEIVAGMQVIKMYTWEVPFAKMIEETRLKEIKYIRYQKLLWALTHFEMYATRTAIFISLVCFHLMGEQITAEIVFSMVALFDVVNHTIASLFEMGVRTAAEVNVCIHRINAFLHQAESISSTESNQSKQSKNEEKESAHRPKVILQNIRAKWISDNPEDTLSGISLNLNAPQLYAVIGSVGSGKSSLLNVILNELPILSGHVTISGRISYYAQEAWIFSASIKQNILFGDDYDANRYRDVCQVCALEPDFKQFPDGDRTQVGESGKMLSGGQKARIALARCIYKMADIYLLDDPLSAVDPSVGTKLFNECVKTFLQDKICILVTHQLQYLRQADSILILNHGKNEGIGTYEELQKTGLDFAQLLGQTSDEETEAQLTREKRVTSHQKRIVEEVKSKADSNRKIEKETMVSGAVTKATYRRYFRSGGNYCTLFFVLLSFVLFQVASRSANWFLSYWVNTEQYFNEHPIDTADEESIRNVLIIEYAAVIIATIVFAIYHKAYFFVVMVRASVNLHNTIFSQLLNAKIRFFHTTPMGRILNRFAKDMGIIDEFLPFVLYHLINVCMGLLGIIVLTSIIRPMLLPPALVLLVIFYGMRCVYIRCSRSVKRIEGINRSPVLTQVSTTFSGLSTIRALGMKDVLIKEFHHYQNEHTAALWLFMAANRAFGLWLDLFCLIFITFVIIVLLTIDTGLSGGDLGLIITQYLGLIGSIQMGMRHWSDMENNMTSVERILEYTQLDCEPTKLPRQRLPKDWPTAGAMEFKDITLKYSDNEPQILKRISFVVRAGERIGIVGRTGAGKSSIATALFQLYATEGAIIIDGVDGAQLPLHVLRSKISIIPQEPMLFEGTMRKNLDPFDQYTDKVLWNALDQVKLKEAIENMLSALNTNVNEGGANFSVGQRQLLCLARAIVRQNRIFVLDEATANVDPHTDELIQSTIRKVFVGCTVLTIAHRLHTVMDSDKILVIDAGECVEFGIPHVLLQNKNGKLRMMVDKTGGASAKDLMEIAEKAYFQDTLDTHHNQS